MSEPVRFLLNGTLVEVDGLAPQPMLLEYLHECAHPTGTKEGRAEGDCGACTVIVDHTVRAQQGTDNPFAATIRVGGVA